MLKFLIVSFLIIMFLRLVAPFLLRWLVKFIFKKTIRNAGFGAPQHPFGDSQNHQYKKPNGNVRVDYIPEEHQKQRKDFEGGQYVDYEEVK